MWGLNETHVLRVDVKGPVNTAYHVTMTTSLTILIPMPKNKDRREVGLSVAKHEHHGDK